MRASTAIDPNPPSQDDAAPVGRSLTAACLAHAIHDGYTDGLYAFLPLWQTQFGLSYAALALVRALYYGTMGGLQVPANHVLRKRTPRFALVASTLTAAGGLAVAAMPFGLPGLCVGFIVAGIGSSVQHPRASALVTERYGKASARPLGIYNFSGDIGKATLPALIALLLPLMAWRAVVGVIVALGVLICAALWRLAPGAAPAVRAAKQREPANGGTGGFALLTAIGALDTAVRMGFLLFLPFLIAAKGGAPVATGVALALVFLGGALGKVACSWLAPRLGPIGTVAATEGATAMLILATLLTPLTATLVVLPLLGVALNGTSSVLYGAVPALARTDVARAFALFYTAVIGAGGVAPIAFGFIADHMGKTRALGATAATAALIVPMVIMLRRQLSKQEAC